MLIRSNRFCFGYCKTFFSFIVTFAETRTVTTGFDMSLYMEQHGSHWTDFHEVLYLKIFRKSVAKIQVRLKSGKGNGYLDKDLLQSTFMISRRVLLRMRNV